MVSIIRYIDDITLGLRDSVSNLSKGTRDSGRYNTTESTLQCGTSFTYLTYYLTWVPTYLKYTCSFLAINVPNIAIAITRFLDGLSLPFSVGVLGVAASVFRFGRETLSLVRQNEFLSIFKKHAWKGPELRNALEEIKNLSDVSRERTLPDWLNEDLALKGGKDYLNDLLKKVYRNDPSAIAESTQLLDTMRSFASKKRILHVLGMTAAFIGAVSCISCFIVCPLAVTIAFLVVIGLLGTVIYMTRRGYVENRNGGFSFSNCVPLFLQNLPDKITGLAGRLVMSNPAQTVQPTPRQFPRLPRHVLDQEFRPRVNLKLSPLSQRQVTSLDARMPTRRYQSMRRPRVLNTAIA